jgi:putative transposase
VPSVEDLDAVADRLVAQARTDGVALTGPGGLLGGLTKRVLESALAAELTEHVGYEPGEPRPGANARNGTTAKTVRTDIGDVRIDVPRDREGSFEPVVVPKHTRRLAGFDEAVISLYAKGLTTGDIANHLADVYGTHVSKDLVSRVRRPGQRGHELVAVPPTGSDLPRGAHRRDRDEGPRCSGRQPARLRRHGHQPRGRT